MKKLMNELSEFNVSTISGEMTELTSSLIDQVSGGDNSKVMKAWVDIWAAKWCLRI